MAIGMAEALAGVWYLGLLGGIRCLAELHVAVTLGGKAPGRWFYALYFVASRLVALLCFWAGAAVPGGLLAAGVLFLFLSRGLGITAGAALFCVMAAWVPGLLWEGLLQLVMGWLAATLPLPAVWIQLAVQALGSALLLLGLLTAYRLMLRRCLPVENIAASPAAMLGCALLVWALGLVAEPGGPVQRTGAVPAPAAFLWLGVGTAAFVCLFAAGYRAALLEQAQQQNQMLEQACRMQARNGAQALRRWEDTRAYQHDVRNHMLVVSGLLGRQQVEAAQQYLKKLVEVADQLAPDYDTGSAALDVLLAEKIHFARQQGIAVQMDLQAKPAGAAAETELCVLFANGLDNAINACMADGAGGRISIYVARRHGFLLLHLENTMGDNGPVIFGTGLKNIRKIAEQYGGSVQVEKDRGIFSLDILLCLGIEE